MGVTRRGARGVGRKDLSDSGIESIKRDKEGDIVMTPVFSSTTIGLSTTGTTTTTTKTARAFASSATVVVSTANTVTAGSVFLSRAGSAQATATAAGGATINHSPTGTAATFSSAPATWTVNITGIAGGTATLTTWTQSKEDTRG